MQQQQPEGLPTTGQLAEYLLQHHGRQQELPMDLTTFHRKYQRRQSRGSKECAKEDLLPAIWELVDGKALDVDKLQVGAKTLVMLTRVHPEHLQKHDQPQAQEQGEAVTKAKEGQDLTQTIAFSSSSSSSSSNAGAAATTATTSTTTFATTTTRTNATTAPPATNIAALLEKPTALEASAVARFKKHGPSVREVCPHGTRGECHQLQQQQQQQQQTTTLICTKVHFRPVIESHTDASLGDCAYLSTCRRTRTCKYIHYQIEDDDESSIDEGTAASEQGDFSSSHLSPEEVLLRGEQDQHGNRGTKQGSSNSSLSSSSSDSIEHKEKKKKARLEQTLAAAAAATIGRPLNKNTTPAQWVNVDVRSFDLSVLGQFPVIMADPPWEIHMDLPYGTMSDDEVCKLDFPKLQEGDGGLLFLWVTGRAMERAREIFDYWGYRQLEEIIWIKTNQLQKVIRTGRTGHWMNHSKEHCLVGVKGDFVTTQLQKGALNRYVDCDVIVAEARETSRKPEEIYDIIERMSPGTRKIEIFGRRHNIREGWVTVGNQLPPTHLVEADVVSNYQKWENEKKGGGGGNGGGGGGGGHGGGGGV